MQFVFISCPVKMFFDVYDIVLLCLPCNNYFVHLGKTKLILL